MSLCFSLIFYSSALVKDSMNITPRHRYIQGDLDDSIPVWASKLRAQKQHFLVQYILSSIHTDKSFVNMQGLHRLKKCTILC